MARDYCLRKKGGRFKYKDILCVPTKYHWRNPSNLDLVETGIIAIRQFHDMGNTIFVPRMGCGLGQLDWDKDVFPLMQKHFAGADGITVLK